MDFAKNVKGFARGAARRFTEVVASMKQAKIQSIRDDAQKAIDEGRVVFVYRINGGSLDYSGSLDGLAEYIEVIETVGWRLDQSTFTHDKEGATSAFLTFRRAEGSVGAR
ncbi:hypothetical protein [Streptomyces sp. CA2R106]|uniref:hypothetical protein n=1 Tax=Streptomyces sp. CA2R106 TaxID=3120153 RepID=UPI0030086B93